ncbi:MAG: TolC family protein [Methylophilus sp.]|nr:TolC family protein [Methylophilus sp.]
MQPFVAIYQKLLLGLFALLLAGCATFSQDGGFNHVEESVQNHIKQKPVWAKSEAEQKRNQEQVQAILAKPLSMEDAVQVALMNNAQLQADFYELQLAESDLVQAGHLPNPSLSMLYARRNGDYKIEQIVTFNIMALLTMGKASAIEQQRFAATQNRMVLQVLDLARKTRNAYVNALASQENVHYLTQVNESAHATYALAKRMREAGNWNALDAGREQGFYTEAALELTKAENQCLQAEERLTTLLGLKHPDTFELPDRLPDLPKTEAALRQIQPDDFAKRLDLQQTRINTEALAKQLGLTKTTQLIDVLEVGPARVLEGRRSDPTKKGLELRFELPVFDWGTAKVKRAEATYMQAIQQANNQAIMAASEVRVQYNQYVTSYDVAKRYRDEVIPLRKSILQESLLRYNGMLMSPFELMAAAREQVLAVNRYMEALRDFWLAESDLDMALVGTPLDSKGY